jgi:hypothetical protein
MHGMTVEKQLCGHLRGGLGSSVLVPYDHILFTTMSFPSSPVFDGSAFNELHRRLYALFCDITEIEVLGTHWKISSYERVDT